MYDITKAIEEVIRKCKDNEKGLVQRTDDKGEVTLWLEAEWVHHPAGGHRVIELSFCYVDTGNVAYSQYIGETMTSYYG